MMKVTAVALVVGVALLLSACGSTPEKVGASQVATPQSSTPSVTKAPEGAAPATTSKSLAAFPTSQKPAEGVVWSTLHVDSYKADFATTCRLLGLTSAECVKFSAMRDAGKCEVRPLPNGVVLDRLGYSRGDGHHVQHRAKVELTNRVNPLTTLCDLGDKFVGFVHECMNPVRIDKPQARALPKRTASAGGSCESPYRTLVVHVWTYELLPVDLQERVRSLIAVAQPRTIPRGPDVSNVLGGELRRRASEGEFSRGGQATVTTYLVGGGVETVLDTRTISEQSTYEIPAEKIIGKTLRQVVSGVSVMSPTIWQRSGQRELWTYWEEWCLHCTMNVHVVVSQQGREKISFFPMQQRVPEPSHSAAPGTFSNKHA